MKKLFSVMALIGAMTFTSCNSNSSEKGETSSSKNEATSTDWDSALDSYEKYVENYIDIMKKVAKGDVTAIASYPELLENAEDFSKKMLDAKNDFSAKQMKRYLTITEKFSTAIMQMTELEMEDTQEYQ